MNFTIILSNIMPIIGLWALIVGKISIAPHMSLKDKYARLYGLTLLILMLPLAGLFGYLTPFVCFYFNIKKVSRPVITIIDVIYQIVILLMLLYLFKKWQERAKK